MNNLAISSTVLLFVYYAGIAILVLLLAARITQVKRQGPEALPGPIPGEAIPRFATESLAGDHFQVPVGGERPTLILFVHSSCATCYEIMPEVNRFHDTFERDVATVVVMAGSQERAKHFVEETHAAPPVIVDAGLIAAVCNVNVSPTAVLVGTDSRVVKSTKGPSLTVPQMLAWLERSDPS